MTSDRSSQAVPQSLPTQSRNAWAGPRRKMIDLGDQSDVARNSSDQPDANAWRFCQSPSALRRSHHRAVRAQHQRQTRASLTPRGYLPVEAISSTTAAAPHRTTNEMMTRKRLLSLFNL